MERPKLPEPIPKYIEQERMRFLRQFLQLKKDYSGKIPEIGSESKSRYHKLFFTNFLKGVNILVSMNLIGGDLKNSCEQFQQSFEEIKFDSNNLAIKQDVVRVNKLLNVIISDLQKPIS